MNIFMFFIILNISLVAISVNGTQSPSETFGKILIINFFVTIFVLANHLMKIGEAKDREYQNKMSQEIMKSQQEAREAGDKNWRDTGYTNATGRIPPRFR